MGVVNVTPDPFPTAAASRSCGCDRARAAALDEGADIVDLGGESTRPGAERVSEDEELRRVIPVLDRIPDLCVSVDTPSPGDARGLQAGASMINDVDALCAPGALQAVAGSNCGVCLMQERRAGDDAAGPHYDDVVGEVKAFLGQRLMRPGARCCGRANRRRSRVRLRQDGQHNLEPLRRLNALATLNAPMLVGLSRKSTLGNITGRAVDERLAGSLAMALLALQAGAAILRVHDVKETKDVVAVWRAYRKDAKRPSRLC